MDIPEKEYRALLARVKAGAALLDEHWTGWTHWSAGIDLERLDIMDIRRCVLGQLFGGYVTGLEYLQAREGHYVAGWEHGFATCGDYPSDHLTHVWRDYLEAS